MSKTYFLSPNLDYPPSSFISLGSIWSNASDPSTCINRDGPLPFHPNMLVNKSWKTDWIDEKDRQRKGLIGMWARFLRVVGIDAEASVNWDKAKASVYKFDRLDTEFIDPSLKYIKESVLSAPVADFIVANEFKKPVYMVTGVKIARGADVAIARSKEAGAHLRTGMSGTPVGEPAVFGPKVKIFSRDFEKTSFGGSSDFVFAYRLRKIFYEKGHLRNIGYNKGALYGLEDRKINESDAVDLQAPSLEVLGLAKVDTSVIGSKDRKDSALDEEDDQECSIVITAK